MKKLGIIGSRTLDPKLEHQVLEWLNTHLELEQISGFVSGGAEGADTLTERLAEQLSKEIIVFPPDYTRYKKNAEVIRNGDIAQTADFCLALVNQPLKTSRGTYDCVKKFKKLKKPVTVLRFAAKEWFLAEVQEL